MIEARVINGSDNIGSVIQLKYDGITIGREKINNTQILSVELVAEENVLRTEDGRKSVTGALGWGAAGGLAFGPIGGLAGLVFGGRKPRKSTTETNICFALYLKDDRKYLISSDLYTFQSIKGMCFVPVQKNVKQSNMDNNFKTDTHKRPIYIYLLWLLGAAFLITLLSLIGEQRTLLAIIIYFPIFIVITFSLVIVNRRNNRNRAISFFILTIMLIIILIVSSVGFSNIESKKNDTKVIPQNNNSTTTILDSAATDEIVGASSVPYEEIGIKGLTVYIY